MTTIAWSLALPGGATMTRPATSGGATRSCSGWRSRIWAAKLRFSNVQAWQRPAFIGGMMSLGPLPRAAMIVAGTLAAAAAFAQADSPPATTGITLPTNVEFLDTSSPGVRKATAIVNGDVITGTDVDQRTALILAAAGGQITPEELPRLREQVLRNLVDETLQIQAAEARDIKIEQSEI